MKAILLALFVTLAVSGLNNWDLVDTLPACYTGLPFNLEISGGKERGYIYEGRDLPNWALLDVKKGIITGNSQSAGAWPVTIRVGDRDGKYVHKQYILNVLDVTKGSVWASDSKNYYERKVQNPFRVVPSRTHSTVASRGAAFEYRFGSENAVGSNVFAFLNLPDGLKGDAKTGTISGAFAVPGIYTLGVESADQSGNTAEGFVTIVVGDAAKGASVAAQVSSLNKVTVNNQVPFVYDISAVQAQQTDADKALFAALAAVNAAKADLANRQSIYDSINMTQVQNYSPSLSSSLGKTAISHFLGTFGSVQVILLG